MKIRNQLVILGAVSAATIALLSFISIATINRLDRVNALQNKGFHARLAMSNQESAYKELLISEHLSNAYSRFEDAAAKLEQDLPAFLSDKFLPTALKGASDEVVGAIPILQDALERSRSNAEAMRAAIRDNFGETMEGIQGLYREMTLNKSIAAFAGYAAAISGYTGIQGLVADNLILVVDHLDETVVVRERASAFALLAGVGIAVALGLGLYLLFFTRSLRGKLKDFRGYTLALSEGDLASAPPLRGTDEFAELSGYLATAISRIRGVIAALKGAAAESESRNEAVKEAFETVAANVEGIGAQVKSLYARSEQARGGVSSSSTAVEEISRNISALAQLMRRQKELILESSSATEQIGRSIDSINAMTRSRGEKAVELSAVATDGRRKAESANERIQGIHSLVSDVKGISDIIAKIAARTNLLAMNAAIEAAHAGDSGAGFAVVAQEIRTLAESTAVNSKQIRDIISRISSSIVEASAESAANAASYGSIAEQVQRFSEAFSDIAKAMEEIAGGSKEVVGIGSSLADIAAEVMGGYDEMESGVHANREEMTRIDAAMGGLVDGVRDIDGRADAIASDVSGIAAGQEASYSAIRDLAAELDRFKT